jgi:hypothetical protein
LISSAGSGLLLSGDGNISVSGGYFVHDDIPWPASRSASQGDGYTFAGTIFYTS